MPENVCQPTKDHHNIDACPTGYGNSVQEVMQKTVTSCSQLSPHSETNRHTSGKGEESVLMLFSVELAMVLSHHSVTLRDVVCCGKYIYITS